VKLTAGSLDKCAVARTFRTTPPLASALHALDPEEEAANLLPWGTDDGDLDPEMDELPEFESARGWDLEPEPELERESRQPEAPAPQASESTTSSPLFTPAAPTPPTPAKPVTPTHAPPSGPPSSFLVAAAPTPSTPNARRAWWREQSASCGALWRVLPRHTYPSLPCPRNRTADTDEFQLPRNLDAVAHPFHPSIAHYAAVSRARVYWVIPVHGPVVVPGLQDPVVDSDARPWASRGMLDLDSDSDSDAAVNPNTVGEEALSRVRSAQSAARPIPLLWTPALLRAFVSGHFARAWSDPARPYGALHLAVSGPKPDPWLGREMPALGAHEHVPLGLGAGLAPVRPEAGDHVRIYCDASRAMAVRLWLHWWTVGAREVAAYADKHTAGTSAAASVTGSDSEDETVQPFKRARLALVGPRGELLMVA
jgi:hypothetical protein